MFETIFLLWTGFIFLGSMFILYKFFCVLKSIKSVLHLPLVGNDYSRIIAYVNFKYPGRLDAGDDVESVKLQLERIYDEERSKGVPEKKLKGFKAYIDSFDDGMRKSLVGVGTTGTDDSGGERESLVVDGKVTYRFGKKRRW